MQWPFYLSIRNQLDWSDEFDQDLSKWNLNVGPTQNQANELQYHTKEFKNIRLNENGQLVIRALKEKRQISNYEYTSAELISKNTVYDGIIEARIKLPSTDCGGALWSVFGLQMENYYGRYPIYKRNDENLLEIAIMDHWSCNPNFVSATLNRRKSNLNIGNSLFRETFISNLTDDFHVYKLDFSSRRLVFYIDNLEIYRVSNPYKMHWFEWFITYYIFGLKLNKSHYKIFLNLAILKNIDSCKIDNSKLPAELIFDYIRYYE